MWSKVPEIFCPDTKYDASTLKTEKIYCFLNRVLVSSANSRFPSRCVAVLWSQIFLI